MNPERYQRLMSLFDQACDLSRPEQAAMISRIRGTDQPLADELADMLRQDEETNALDQPMVMGSAALASAVADLEQAEDGRSASRLDPLDTDLKHRSGVIFDGRYRIDALLGRGGMGSVYRATQLSMQRPVAIKVLRRSLAGDADQLRRFEREARAASQLSHPNVLRVYDFGQTNAGELYLVSELLDGEPLSTRLREAGRLAPATALRLTIEILEGLSCAHAHGIVHRDLKPENIFLTPVHGRGEVAKVLDFGLARSVADGPLSRLTRTGAILGTPAYMSPEQIEGDDAVDHRADLYSLGVVLYELVTGRLPFEADNMIGLLVAHQIEPPAPLRLGADPGLAALERLVLDCLAKAPVERPANAEALLRRCRELLVRLEGGDPTRDERPGVAARAEREPVSPGRTAGRWLWAALTIVLVAGLGWWLTRGPAPETGDPVERAESETERAATPAADRTLVPRAEKVAAESALDALESAGWSTASVRADALPGTGSARGPSGDPVRRARRPPASGRGIR